MRRSTLVLSVAFAAALVMGFANLAGAATCQVPLAIGTAGSDANVLILQDNSGSMNEALQSSAYNPNTHYSGNFSNGTDYNISSSGTYSPRSFNSHWATTPTAFLVTSDQGEAGVYHGNYLNWIFYNATSAQRSAIPTVTRIQSSKATVNAVLSAVTGCRFGLEIFNGDNGGTILCPLGTAVSTIQTSESAIDANAWTPLAEASVTALNYYKTAGANPTIQSACQKNFLIIVTDGLPTHDTSMPPYITDANHNGYYLDDVAKYLYRNDMRADLDGIQNVAVFTVGFNVDDGSLLQTTADLGGGEYYSVTDGASLQSALLHDFSVIAARVSAGAAVSVVASEDRTNNRLYRARYESQTWKGYLESFNLPYHAGDASLWDAGAQLAARDPSTRTLLTSSTGTNTYAFSTANSATLRTLMGAPDTATCNKIIRYTQGMQFTGTRDRSGWKLGDIVDAAPVSVGRPNSFNSFLNYPAFRAAKFNRSEKVYVAANDGMLHCVDAATGAESWAYVPKNLLPKLADLMDPSYCHEYFLNMTPAVYDIYVGGAWKTMLIGGEAQGGSTLFALDVTSPAPDTVSVMWDINIAALKGSWNSPSLVRDKHSDSYMLCVGTGYDTTTAQTNLIVLNPADGSTLNTIALGSPVAGNKTTKATVIDKDFDGYDDLMYLGDLAGNIWRVDLTANPWTVTKLINVGQPIQAPPILTLDNMNRVMVFFGTGKYLTMSDPASTAQQSIYGVVDDDSGNTVALTDLVDQSTTIHSFANTTRGWFLNMTNDTGERVTHTAALVAGTLYVPSFRPNSTACTGGGQSWLYSLDYKDGSAPDHNNGTANNVTTGRSQSMGDGILADPSVDLLSEQVILQSSNAVLMTEDISAGVKKLVVHSWRQRWN